MLDGDLVDTAFTTAQLAELERTLMRAGESTGAHFSAYVGKLPARRDSALSIHRQLDDPDMSVLVAVDPESRFVEVVTGAIVRDHLDDQSCRLACLTMTSRFAIGDIAAGIRDGIIVLGDPARSSRALHTDLPD